MSVFQAIKRAFVRGPTFEVLEDKAGFWFFHEKASNGQIKSVSEAYSSKEHAVRAAKKSASEAPGSSWRVLG